MNRTSSLMISLALALSACMAPEVPGGYINEGPWAGDDDDAAVEPSLSLAPSTVVAGSFVDIEATLIGFDLSGADVAYGPSSEEVVFHAIQGVPDGDVFTLRFHFGLLAWEGPHPWGLLNADQLLMSEFDVVAIDPPELLEPGLPAADVDLGDDEQFAAWELQIPANTYAALRVRPEDEVTVPLLWLMDVDGVSVVDELTEQEMMVWYTGEEPFSGYVRVQDRSGLDGMNFALDLASIDAGEPTPIVEVEPNDAAEEWQDLGVLGVGRYAVSGNAATAGHDKKTNDPNGDLDVFQFELSEPSRVAFNLHWSGHGDFDAVLYVHEEGETELGFDSKAVVDSSMATLANPEDAELQLDAGVRYTLLIANWQGEPLMDWALDLAVYPGFFPGD
ncbi:MAG: hypothetical protein GY898_20785 [Proteobacteria bacterium]|nr:hypothetical protein [Pseudomonadota bacterium]